MVVGLKRDPIPPVKDAIHPHPKDGALWHMVVKKAIPRFKWHTPIQAEYFIFAIPPTRNRCTSEINGLLQKKGTSLQKWKINVLFQHVTIFYPCSKTWHERC